MALNIEFKRGDIVRVSLNPVQGSEQGGERPSLIISPDEINQYSPVILIAPVASKKTDRLYPFEVLLEPNMGGLSKRSKVLLAHIRAIDKKRVHGRYGALPADVMAKVNTAIEIATGLAVM